MRQDEFAVLLRRKAALHKIQIHVLIKTVEFVTHHRMADVSEMDANLVLPSGEQFNFEEAERAFRPFETRYDAVTSRRRSAVGANSVLRSEERRVGKECRTRE